MKGRGHAPIRLYFLKEMEAGFGLQAKVACSLNWGTGFAGITSNS